MKKDTKGAAIGCFVLLLLWPVGSLWSGYALSVLWTWFVVATFEVRPLSIPAAIGIAMVMRYLTYQWNVKEPEYESAYVRTVTAAVMMFMFPAFALVFGYLVHLFM